MSKRERKLTGSKHSKSLIQSTLAASICGVKVVPFLLFLTVALVELGRTLSGAAAFASALRATEVDGAKSKNSEQAPNITK